MLDMFKRRLDLWLPSYVASAPARMLARRARAKQLTHVFFLICDHYEPRHKASRPEQPKERVDTWRREYPAFQARCRAQFGHAPLHSWFYPPHHGSEHLSPLADMAFEGGGEVELHYHHHDDTAETLRRDLKATIADYQRHGLLYQSGAPARTAFGFVHGDWTLDNARNGIHCGVNGELSLLKDLGCWGDFTMPSANESQTRKINSIYYAVDDPAHHKSHDHGTDACAGATTPGFWLMQGPLAINWRAPGYPRVENASITTENWGRPDRVRSWLDCDVHVKGRPDWLFIKLHTHGGVERDFDALFGEKGFKMHAALNDICNDGRAYKLHYVTARQAYNLARAAEAGHSGDPQQWLDFELAPPATRWYALDAEHDLHACTATTLKIDRVESTATTRLKTHVGGLREVRGPISAIDFDAASFRLDLSAESGVLQLDFDAPVDLQCAGGSLQALDASNTRWQASWPAGASITLTKRAQQAAAV